MKLREIILYLKSMKPDEAIEAIMTQPNLTETEKSFILCVYLKSLGIKIK